MSKRAFCVAAMLAGALVVALPLQSSLAENKGRQRIVMMDGKYVDCEIISETKDAYVVEPRPHMQMTIRKNQVSKITPLTASGETVTAATATGTGQKIDPAAQISDAEIAAIIGDVTPDVEEEDLASSSAEMEDKLPVNEQSVKDMKRIAGSKAKTMETAHFVLVYTSELDLARKLASRLESTYRWNLRMASMIGIPVHRPAYALEIYFFGTHHEYEAYANTRGGLPPGALGFYEHETNRSCFFNMLTDPSVAPLLERLKEKDVDWRARQFLTNKISRVMTYFNLTVIQHEASHHIHFNVGYFGRKAEINRWVAEGLAQMFEVPPVKSGAGLGTYNNYRLFEFKQQYSHIQAMGDFRLFVVDDEVWFKGGGASYSKGWALVNYLWTKKRDKFNQYMKLMSQRQDDKHVGPTERQKEFEDLFGTIDEKWVKDFFDYTNSLQVKKSELPFE